MCKSVSSVSVLGKALCPPTDAIITQKFSVYGLAWEFCAEPWTIVLNKMFDTGECDQLNIILFYVKINEQIYCHFTIILGECCNGGSRGVRLPILLKFASLLGLTSYK